MIDELFEPKAPPLPPVTRWRGCVVCGGKDHPRARAGHDVCTACVKRPDAARARLEVQRGALVSQQHEAARLAANAYAALSEDERARWGAFAELRERRRAGHTLGPDEARRLAATEAAYADPDHPKISAALREYAHAEECLFWANQADEHGQRAIDIRLAQLAVCLEEPTP